MKQLLSILLALVALSVYGQKATVESVAADPLNIAAAKYPMTDLNGNKAPLVVVRVLADNVEFQGSVLDGGVVKKTGEYWVYMGAGAKMLHIHSDRFLPVEIHFPEYGIPRLESAVTYIVTLSLPQAAAQQSAAAGYNYLVLTVSPPTAQVTIDGKPTDVQNGGTAKRLLRSGATYTYRVEASGYQPEEGTVAMDGRKVERTVTLRSAKGTLAVSTATAGTEIYVNGDRMGAGSWRGELQPGDYLVEGRLAGHRSVEQLVSIATGESRTLAIPALTPVTGSLNVDYTPAGAFISIDGTASGTTPNVVDGLPVGTHTVSITADGYQPATLTATVAEGTLTTLEGHLERLQAQTVATQTTTQPTRSYSSTPIHLALCAIGPNGNVNYITTTEWQRLSTSERSSYSPKGVCLIQSGESFLIELHNQTRIVGDVTLRVMVWKNAIKFNLPTKEQGKVIGKNRVKLNEVLSIFNGEAMNRTYWTKSEKNSTKAWLIYMGDGGVAPENKSTHHHARAVAPCP